MCYKFENCKEKIKQPITSKDSNARRANID